MSCGPVVIYIYIYIYIYIRVTSSQVTMNDGQKYENMSQAKNGVYYN